MTDHARHSDQIRIPKPIAIAMFGLMLTAIIGSGLSQATGIGTTREAMLTRGVTFTVTRAEGDALVATRSDGKRFTLAPLGVEKFPRFIIRGIETVRGRDGVPLTAPLRLVIAPDGERMLADDATRRIVRLRAFGGDNGHDFDALLEKGA